MINHEPFFTGILRRELNLRFWSMGFDTTDVMLQIPLQAVWTAIEELDRQFTRMMDSAGKIEATVAIEPEEAQAAYDFSGMSSLYLAVMQRQVRESGEDKEFLDAILVELGDRRSTP